MPTARKASTKSHQKSAAADAVKLLTADHNEVRKLFKEYDKLVKAEAADEERSALAEHICVLLTVHTQIEEEIFYPSSREVLDEDDEDLLDEAAVEHASAKDLIAQIRAMQPSDPLYDAKVKVLGEYIDHHATEEEDELFPKVKKDGLDTALIGEALKSRKEELLEKMSEGVEAR